MDGSQVSVFKEGDKVRLSSFLTSHDGRGLEAEIGLRSHEVSMSHEAVIGDQSYLEVLSNFTNQPLKGELADKELSGLLVTPDLTEGDGTRTEPVWLLDSSSGSLKKC